MSFRRSGRLIPAAVAEYGYRQGLANGWIVGAFQHDVADLVGAFKLPTDGPDQRPLRVQPAIHGIVTFAQHASHPFGRGISRQLTSYIYHHWLTKRHSPGRHPNSDQLLAEAIDPISSRL